MADLLDRRKVILVKEEVTYGTDVTPVNTADAMQVENVNLTPYGGATVQMNHHRSGFGSRKTFTTGVVCELSFDVVLGGQAGDAAAPAYEVLLKCMGLVPSASNNAWAYTTSDLTAEHESCSIYAHMDGTRHKLIGCKGTGTLTFAAGQFPKLSCTFMCLYDSTPAAITLPVPTLTSWVDPVPMNAINTTVVTFGSYAAKLQSLTIDLGIQNEYRNYPNHSPTAGIIDFTDRNVTGSITVEAPAVGTYDLFSDIESHQSVTERVFTLTHAVATPANAITVVGNQVQLMPMTIGEQGKIVHYTMPMSFNEGAAAELVMTVGNTSP